MGGDSSEPNKPPRQTFTYLPQGGGHGGGESLNAFVESSAAASYTILRDLDDRTLFRIAEGDHTVVLPEPLRDKLPSVVQIQAKFARLEREKEQAQHEKARDRRSHRLEQVGLVILGAVVGAALGTALAYFFL